MNEFLKKHSTMIAGVLSCFDRLIFKGYLPLMYPEALEHLLDKLGILYRDFKYWAKGLANEIHQHGKQWAAKNDRIYEYLRKPVDKHAKALKIAQEQNITEGLVCVLAAVEPCNTYRLAWAKDKPHFVRDRRKCLHVYYYYMDSQLGLFHVQIQTWFPFTIQIYINGHEVLARKMERHGVPFEQVDNAFVSVGDYERAQRFSDAIAKHNWPKTFAVFARRVNPLLSTLLRGATYHWVTDQSEYATDIVFKSSEDLGPLYSSLLKYASTCLSAEDILRFFGRKLHGAFKGDIVTDVEKTARGSRVRHRIRRNWIKMYDKGGIVLRVETVINHPRDFKIFREAKCKGKRVKGWFPMPKGIAFLDAYQRIALAANGRYLDTLAAIENPSEAYHVLHQLCEPAEFNGRRVRGFNPLREADKALFVAVLRGEHAIRGFTHHDLLNSLYKTPTPEQPIPARVRGRVTRLIHLLRGHGLVAKIPRARRYRVTAKGARLMSAALYLTLEDMPKVYNALAS